MPTNSTERKPANSNLASAPAKTLRVLHVINGEHYSGAERVQDLLGLRLPEQGIEVAFACVKPGKFETARQSTNCPVYDTSMQSRMDMRAAWRMAKIIRQQQYEIVHAHTPRSLMIGRVAAALAGVPIVYHVHSPTSRDTTHSLRNWLNSASERFSLAGVSRLICVSQSLAEHMRACGYREDLIRVVPNGVPSGPELSARETPSGIWTLSMVALFRPRKGLEVLLYALAELRAQQVPVRLRAIGPFETPEYETTIRELVAELGLEDAIDWVGFTREVNLELTQTDLFVLPSLFGEGLPMVVLEAMAAGVPVIGTAIEGIPEAIRDGVDGLIAAPNDATSLAMAIQSVIAGEVDWQTLRASARLRQVALFSDHSMATGVAHVYRELLA